MTHRHAGEPTVTIVGASVAGVATARALRAKGFAGHITLLSDETEWPYDKPPLSKQMLTGEWDTDRVSLLTPEQAQELSVDVRLGDAASALDIAEQAVELADGGRVPHDLCVIATGVSARLSPWPHHPGVLLLRTLADAIELRARLRKGGSLAVIGGGFIGAEVASSAAELGLEVTVTDPLPSPMARVVGPDAARVFTELAASRGVTLRLGVGVDAIEADGGELVIRLTDGHPLRAATAVVGIGAVPNDGWLRSSGLEIDDGVVCDRFCRARGDESVFAVGDVARWETSPGQTARVEHWTNAVQQANCAAHNIVHPDALQAYDQIPYVWTDQHGCRFQLVGRPAEAVRHICVGDLFGERPRGAFVFEGGTDRVVGAMTINWPRAVMRCRRALADGATVASLVEGLSSLAAAPAR